MKGQPKVIISTYKLEFYQQSIVRRRGITEAIYTKFTNWAINKAFDLPACYYGVLQKHMFPR